ncbi:MAG: hypothetical protein ACI3ZR_09430 [bacterium]
MNFFKKILNTENTSNEESINDDNKVVDVIPQSIRKLLDDDNINVISDVDDNKKQTIEVVSDNKTYLSERELNIKRNTANNHKDGNKMTERDRLKSVKVEKNVDFEEIYRNADIRSGDDSIELVMNTIRKLAPFYETKSLEILQITVRTTLETAGRDLEKIKEDGNNKVTAIKKYKESLENEINKIINDNKNKIIELENKIEQYKMDIQNKKDTAREVSRQTEDRIAEIVNATNFLDLEGSGTILATEEED